MRVFNLSIKRILKKLYQFYNPVKKLLTLKFYFFKFIQKVLQKCKKRLKY